jgi:hypothetical protein
MTETPADRARALATRLNEQGQQTHAENIAAALAMKSEQGLFAVLRETCETLLTALEALDPKTRLMAEELRLEVEKRLAV